MIFGTRNIQFYKLTNGKIQYNIIINLSIVDISVLHLKASPEAGEFLRTT